MNEAQFTQEVERIFVAIEDAVEEAIEESGSGSGAELDYEGSGGLLTIDCEDSNTQVIVSRQVALLQIWVAAKSGGFHCEHRDDGWFCTTTDESLKDLLNRVLSEQSESTVTLDWV